MDYLRWLHTIIYEGLGLHCHTRIQPRIFPSRTAALEGHANILAGVCIIISSVCLRQNVAFVSNPTDLRPKRWAKGGGHAKGSVAMNWELNTDEGWKEVSLLNVCDEPPLFLRPFYVGL